MELRLQYTAELLLELHLTLVLDFGGVLDSKTNPHTWSDCISIFKIGHRSFLQLCPTVSELTFALPLSSAHLNPCRFTHTHIRILL